jgi:hypothetical protein
MHEDQNHSWRSGIITIQGAVGQMPEENNFEAAALKQTNAIWT